MTEKDLFEYLRCKNKIKKLLRNLEECNEYLTSPKSCNLTSIPGGTGDDEARMIFLDRKTKIKRQIEELVMLRDLAEHKLDMVSDKLEEDLDIDIFDYLYRKGLDISDIAITLAYTRSWIYKRRKHILLIAAGIQA